jgi:putative tricarboxylic transport membrane protein
MKRFGWPRPAFLIGFVLAPQVGETYLYQAVQFAGWLFASSQRSRRVSLIIAAITGSATP